MASTDKLIGVIISLISLFAIIFEIYYLLAYPAMFPSKLNDVVFMYAITIPVFLMILVVFGIMGWIGLTLITTPPPVEWTEEDLQKATEEVETESAETS